MDFATLMALEPHGPDTWVGTGPSYPWGGLYGGQIVAQALRAATLSVEPPYVVHSLHAYFIRRGDAEAPIRFEVDRQRNGRSFATRTVVARQAVGAILTLSASFQRPEEGPLVQTATVPDVPGPDELPAEDGWSPLFDRRFVTRPTHALDAPAGDFDYPDLGPGRAAAWLRVSTPVGEDPALAACALAYLSDDIPTDAVRVQHPLSAQEPDLDDSHWMSASLDHAIWFHRPFDPHGWHLHDFACHGFLSSRGLAVGHVFTTDAAHVATVAQEIVLRHR